MSTVEIFDAFAQMNLVSSSLITAEEREEINKCIVNQIKALVDKIFEKKNELSAKKFKEKVEEDSKWILLPPNEVCERILKESKIKVNRQAFE